MRQRSCVLQLSWFVMCCMCEAHQRAEISSACFDKDCTNWPAFQILGPDLAVVTHMLPDLNCTCRLATSICAQCMRLYYIMFCIRFNKSEVKKLVA
jgi:hypothetical protein